ncbi:MAG: hypothetical protein RIB47_05675 [Cyclobacteriaceae bacterium]
MKHNLGIWIDSKKAIFVHLKDGKKEVTTFESGIDSKERIPGETKQFVRFGNQFSNLEKQKENRYQQQMKGYLKEVADQLIEADSFVIFGPAGVKHELEKLILKRSDLSSKLRGVETTDSMTENQIAAWVINYFKE